MFHKKRDIPADQDRLLYIIRKSVREVSKYLMKHSSLRDILNDGEDRVKEFLGSIKNVQLQGKGGIFRTSGVMKESREVIENKRKEIEKIQESLKGKESWRSGICPNCNSDCVEWTEVCFIKVIQELKRVKKKQEVPPDSP